MPCGNPSCLCSTDSCNFSFLSSFRHPSYDDIDIDEKLDRPNCYFRVIDFEGEKGISKSRKITENRLSADQISLRK